MAEESGKKRIDRPVIGVTGPSGRLVFAWWFTRFALKRDGAIPVRMTPAGRMPRQALDAVIIGGGADIAPHLYEELAGGPPGADPERDAFEMAVLRQALADGIPVLGICRGAQLLNVVLGGSLHRNLSTRRSKTSNRRSLLACKTVALKCSSRLRGIVKASRCRVNSLHNQAIRRLGRRLDITARDADGIVQAVEYEQGFVVGVQWHPEYLPYRAEHRRIFQALVQAAQESPAEAGHR